MMKINIRTKFRKDNDYLLKTIESLQENTSNINLLKNLSIFFSDFRKNIPDEYLNKLNDYECFFYETEYDKYISKKQIGIKGAYNFNNLLKFNPSNDKYILTLEDDIIFKYKWDLFLKNIINELESKENKYLLSLYTSKNIISEKNHIKLNLQDDYTYFFGSQGVLISNDICKDLSYFNEKINLTKGSIKQNYIYLGMDHLISMYSLYKNIPIYTTHPSVIQHIGKKSTGLGEFNHKSITFDTIKNLNIENEK